MSWGGALPEGVEVTQCEILWGSRAIFSGHTDFIDQLGDRQGSSIREMNEERTEVLTGDRDLAIEIPFENWFDDPDRKVRIDELNLFIKRQLCRDKKTLGGLIKFALQTGQSSRSTYIAKKGRFGIRATPNGSYGYMYLRAWALCPNVEEQEPSEVINERK